jgi:vacuolar-type H+-ATPase subunit E/Vma4
MEAEIAARIAEIDRDTDRELAEIKERAARSVQEAGQREQTRIGQQLRAYAREKRQSLENDWRIRIRNFQFEVAEQVLDQVREASLRVRQRNDYPAIWGRLLEEAGRVYSGQRRDRPVLRVSPEDECLARAAAIECVGVEIDAAICDGVELESADRRMLVKNTLASRLRRAHDQFLKSISDAIHERMKQ